MAKKKKNKRKVNQDTNTPPDLSNKGTKFTKQLEQLLTLFGPNKEQRLSDILRKNNLFGNFGINDILQLAGTLNRDNQNAFINELGVLRGNGGATSSQTNPFGSITGFNFGDNLGLNDQAIQRLSNIFNRFISGAGGNLSEGQNQNNLLQKAIFGRLLGPQQSQDITVTRDLLQRLLDFRGSSNPNNRRQFGNTGVRDFLTSVLGGSFDAGTGTGGGTGGSGGTTGGSGQGTGQGTFGGNTLSPQNPPNVVLPQLNQPLSNPLSGFPLVGFGNDTPTPGVVGGQDGIGGNNLANQGTTVPNSNPFLDQLQSRVLGLLDNPVGFDPNILQQAQNDITTRIAQGEQQSLQNLAANANTKGQFGSGPGAQLNQAPQLTRQSAQARANALLQLGLANNQAVFNDKQNVRAFASNLGSLANQRDIAGGQLGLGFSDLGLRNLLGQGQLALNTELGRTSNLLQNKGLDIQQLLGLGDQGLRRELGLGALNIDQQKVDLSRLGQVFNFGLNTFLQNLGLIFGGR